MISIAELTEDTEEHNQMIIKRTRAAKDKALDWEAWRKTEEELALGILLGPFLSLDSVPVRLVRLIRRIGIWESHGGQDRSCRLIDDGLEGDQNRPSVLMWRPGSLTRSHQCM